MFQAPLKRIFRLLGKSDRKVIAIFAASSEAFGDAVEHVRAGAAKFPIWLITTGPVGPEVSQKCERVLQFSRGFGAAWRAAALLWPQWVTLSVVTYTGERGFGWLKLAPFLVPPWKLLVMNEHGDFFNAWPSGIVLHLLRRLRDRLTTAAESAKDLLLGVFWKVAWTLLDPWLERTAAPWRRPQVCPPLAAEPELVLERGVLVCIGKAGVNRRALESALSRLDLPYKVVIGPPPSEVRYQYILAVEETPAGDLRDLLKLHERPETFAARLQLGRAGFQKDVLPRAAFRKLQPAEAAAVVAPFPGVLLLDAAKVTRLGGFSNSGSARYRWLLLFWKAAAAGWKSYDVGVAQATIPMIPDRAGAEMQFCFRLLRGRPQPAAEALSFDAQRGSMCFHPSYERPLRREARRVLIVSPYLPFPLSHGGAVRIFYLARQLSRRFDLLLLTFRERDDFVDYARLSSCFARVIVVDHDERRRRDGSVPEAVAQFRSRAMAAAIREAAKLYHPDVLQVEYTQLAEYREALRDVPAVLVEHDVTFSLYEQLASAASQDDRARAEFDRWYRFESYWLRRYEAVAVMSEDEKNKAVRAGAEPDRVWVVPNGVDTERFQPAGCEPQGPPELLYVGSFRHLPNMVGFEYMQKEILPRLWPRFPELRVRVVAGPEYQRHWREFGKKSGRLEHADPRITIEGFVEDVAPYYARAQIVVVPLKVSAGTNIKVMEALASGKPVVSTPVGCAGLGLAEGEEILVADEAEKFCTAVARLLEDRGLRSEIGERARRAAVERYSWERSAERAAAMYEAMWSRQAAGQINSCQVVRSSPF